MTRKIIFWHGLNKHLEDKIGAFCRYSDGEYWWDGSLDDFVTAYDGPIMVYPDSICVTQFKSFSAR
jgi:hypothetical protein